MTTSNHQDFPHHTSVSESQPCATESQTFDPAQQKVPDTNVTATFPKSETLPITYLDLLAYALHSNKDIALCSDSVSTRPRGNDDKPSSESPPKDSAFLEAMLQVLRQSGKNVVEMDMNTISSWRYNKHGSSHPVCDYVLVRDMDFFVRNQARWLEDYNRYRPACRCFHLNVPKSEPRERIPHLFFWLPSIQYTLYSYPETVTHYTNIVHPPPSLPHQNDAIQDKTTVQDTTTEGKTTEDKTVQGEAAQDKTTMGDNVQEKTKRERNRLYTGALEDIYQQTYHQSASSSKPKHAFLANYEYPFNPNYKSKSHNFHFPSTNLSFGPFYDTPSAPDTPMTVNWRDLSNLFADCELIFDAIPDLSCPTSLSPSSTHSSVKGEDGSFLPSSHIRSPLSFHSTIPLVSFHAM